MEVNKMKSAWAHEYEFFLNCYIRYEHVHKNDGRPTLKFVPTGGFWAAQTGLFEKRGDFRSD